MQITSKRYKFIIIQASLAIVIFLVSILLSGVGIRQLEQQQILKLRKQVSERSIAIQSELLNEINSSLNLVLGLVGFINVKQVPSQAEFSNFAKVIIRKSDIIMNIGLAPGNIINYIYPLEGNEAAIGLDYMKTPKQKEAVIRAIETRKEVIAGPVDLVQGGVGLIARIPVFTGEELDKFWGVASIVVDIEKLFKKVRIQASDDWLNIAIKGKDGKGFEGGMIFGVEETFYGNPVLTTLSLPDGHWIIAAEPKNGWVTERNFWSRIIFWFGLLLALIVTLFILNILSTNRKMHFLALHDPLTKLANRRMFQILSDQHKVIAERNKLQFYLIYIDLDNFKKINDLHGHKMGDTVLRKVTEFISNGIRETDIFARMGGDEFILLPCQVDNINDLNILCNKVIHLVNTVTEELNLKTRIGCSIGISCYPNDSESIDELIIQADEAMYESKENGKNRVSYYSH
jgi:diguanylate cyclase (GGDEF)-like protein